MQTASPIVAARGGQPASGALDVQVFLNTHRFSGYQWLIFLLCFLVVLLDGFDTAAIGYIAPSLIGEWGVAKPALAPVLSAALFGLAAGALSAGPLADKFGRKLVLTVSVLVFGIACAISGYATSLTELTVLRFVTGLGLGAAMPNAVTLTSEYCPDRQRAMLTNAMFCGFPLGAAFGGFLASWMIPHWGWRSVLHLGGAAPLVLAALMLWLLPESVRYLVARGRPVEKVRRVLVRISPQAAEAKSFVLSEAKPVSGGQTGLAVVLSKRYLLGSVMLWLAYFMGLVIFYALINWMPILLKDAGMAPQKATLVSALFPLGGVGAVLFGWLMDRFNANRIIAAGYALTAASIYLVGQVVGQDWLLVSMVFVAGAIMNTAQSSMPALAAAFYPTQGRATGVAWMLGIGRFGGIAGSFLVAELALRQLGFGQIFTVVAVPGLIATVALLIKQWAHPESASAASAAEARGSVPAH
ncbi:4-hydroxybenzoate transporter [Rhodoferax koreense]|uniref:4-hydroxybenzoate transporter n=1 Tax=Rhodoferax koreensis TaxID=1842727 RepID=A0A1P8JYD8_9BURK|nr:MFS transporter [Rhodoferax koreense]APW38691.1 4-hydroxybenzoate transporter [Rhodoferax koreense]